jgi:hypothetical protein
VKLALAPLGKPETLNATSLLNPLLGVIETVVVPAEPPPVTDTLPGFTPTAKSGKGAVPLSESVADAFLLLAVRLALTAPVLVGANCTVTVHDVPAPRLVALHVSLVIVNSDEPDAVT